MCEKRVEDGISPFDKKDENWITACTFIGIGLNEVTLLFDLHFLGFHYFKSFLVQLKDTSTSGMRDIVECET